MLTVGKIVQHTFCQACVRGLLEEHQGLDAPRPGALRPQICTQHDPYGIIPIRLEDICESGNQTMLCQRCPCGSAYSNHIPQSPWTLHGLWHITEPIARCREVTLISSESFDVGFQISNVLDAPMVRFSSHETCLLSFFTRSLQPVPPSHC